MQSIAARTTQMELAVQVARAAHGQRRLAPCRQFAHRFARFDREREAARLARPRQHLQRNLRDEPEAAEAAANEARHVISRHVLHDLPAEPKMLRFARNDPAAEDKVAHRTGPRPARTGQAARDRAAYGCAAAEGRRLAGKHLAGFLEDRVHFGERGAGARGDHELARVIAHDSAMRARIDFSPGDGPPEKRLAVAAANGERLLFSERTVNLLDEPRAVVDGNEVASHQKRSSSGKGRAP
jgi:hypothetical protein